jgi:hypothetical protein
MSAWTEIPSADNPPAPSWRRANHGHMARVTGGLTFGTKA